MAQRQFQRVNHKVPASLHMVYGSGQASNFEGEVADISVSGLGVLLRNSALGPIGPGSKAQIIIEKAGGQKLVVSGSVVRSMVNPDNSQQIALRFDRVRYDIVAGLPTHQRVVVDLNPYGWTDYRQFLGGEEQQQQ